MDPVQMVILGVVVVVAVIGFLYRKVRADHTEILGEWDGDIVAVVVTLTPNARVRGDEEPQRAGVLIRHRETGAEHAVGWVNPAQLPRQVKVQVYDPGWVINSYDPNFRLPKDLRRQAQQAAREGGFRFQLPEPIPVHCGNDDRGEIHWRIASGPAITG